MTMSMHDWVQPISTYLLPYDTMEEAARMLLDTGLDVIAVGDASGRLLGAFSVRSLYQMITEKMASSAPIRDFIKTDAMIIQLDKLSEMTPEQMEQKVSNSLEGYCMV